MKHIVFEQNSKERLEEFFKTEFIFSGEIFVLEDDYSVGPLTIDVSQIFEIRKMWWSEVLKHSPYIKNIDKVNDNQVIFAIKQYLEVDSNNQICIWYLPNAHDLTGYFLLLQLLQNYISQISTIFLHNLPFLNEKGQLFYPKYLNEIPISELKKTTRFIKQFPLNDLEIENEAWNKITEQNRYLRLYDSGKKLLNYEADYLDKDIISFLQNTPQKMIKIIHQYQHKYKNYISDVFIGWRLIELIKGNKILANLEDNLGWKEIEVRIE